MSKLSVDAILKSNAAQQRAIREALAETALVRVSAGGTVTVRKLTVREIAAIMASVHIQLTEIARPRGAKG